MMCLMSTSRPASPRVPIASWMMEFLAASIPRTSATSRILFVMTLSASTPSTLRTSLRLLPSVMIFQDPSVFERTALEMPSIPLILAPLMASYITCSFLYEGSSDVTTMSNPDIVTIPRTAFTLFSLSTMSSDLMPLDSILRTSGLMINLMLVMSVSTEAMSSRSVISMFEAT